MVTDPSDTLYFRFIQFLNFSFIHLHDTFEGKGQEGTFRASFLWNFLFVEQQIHTVAYRTIQLCRKTVISGATLISLFISHKCLSLALNYFSIYLWISVTLYVLCYLHIHNHVSITQSTLKSSSKSPWWEGGLREGLLEILVVVHSTKRESASLPISGVTNRGHLKSGTMHTKYKMTTGSLLDGGKVSTVSRVV